MSVTIDTDLVDIQVALGADLVLTVTIGGTGGPGGLYNMGFYKNGIRIFASNNNPGPIMLHNFGSFLENDQTACHQVFVQDSDELPKPTLNIEDNNPDDDSNKTGSCAKAYVTDLLITAHPTDQTYDNGDTWILDGTINNVGVEHEVAWYKNGVNITSGGSTKKGAGVTDVSQNQGTFVGGQHEQGPAANEELSEYHFFVSNSVAGVEPAEFSVNNPADDLFNKSSNTSTVHANLYFVMHPSDQNLDVGDTLFLFVYPIGVNELNDYSYQWYRDIGAGRVIWSGQTNQLVFDDPIAKVDEGTYDCQVTDDVETLTSNTAFVTVNEPLGPSADRRRRFWVDNQAH